VTIVSSESQARAGFTLLVGVLLLLMAGKAIVVENLDPDFFWHLKVAEQLQAVGVGPLVDDLSFASMREPWTPYSWLAQLAMKFFWDAGGLPLTVLVQAGLLMPIVGGIVLSGAELSRLVHGRVRGMNIVLGAMLAIVMSYPYLSYRPVTFALALLSIAAWLITRDRRMGASRAVWTIPLMTALMVNLHLYAIFVPLWLGAIAAGSWSARYAKLAALSAAGCLCTPMLPGVMEQIFAYGQTDVMVREGRIAEMQPIWSGPMGWGLLAIAVATLVMTVAQRKRMGWWAVLWVIVSIGLMLRLGRFAPVAAMVIGPMLATLMPELKDRVLNKRPVKWALAVLLAIGCVRLATSVPRTSELDSYLARNGAEALSYPTQAAQFVERTIEPARGRMINEFTWGGYLGWRLGERYQVLVDGRTQLFSEAFWRATYLGDEASTTRLLGEQQGDVAILPTAKSRFDAPLRSMGWREVYRDEIAIVLVPPGARVVVVGEE
jgi:hypothetical protein